jgi:hypothetical protein
MDIRKGDTVTVGQGTAKYRVVLLEKQLDAADEPYVMATLTTDKGNTSKEETSRLHKVLKGQS